MKIHPVETELFYADRHVEANNQFSLFCESDKTIKENATITTKESITLY